LKINILNRKEHPIPKLPFAAEKDSKQFMTAVMQSVIKGFDGLRVLPSENFLVFYHGREWSAPRLEKDAYKNHSGELALVRNQCVVRVDRILAQDMNLVSDFVRETAGLMGSDLSQRTMAAMLKVAKETGQTLSTAPDGSLADSYLEMIRRTELLVDADGKVLLPTLCSLPGVAEKLAQEIEARGPEFKKLLQDTHKEKERQALAREAERLARYDVQE
jgi:hypothetical protein